MSLFVQNKNNHTCIEYLSRDTHKIGKDGCFWEGGRRTDRCGKETFFTI